MGKLRSVFAVLAVLLLLATACVPVSQPTTGNAPAGLRSLAKFRTDPEEAEARQQAPAASTGTSAAGDPDRQVASSSGQPSANSQAVVGNRGEPGQNDAKYPDSWAEEEYAKRAYPADVLPADTPLLARAAFEQVKNRGVGQGKNAPGQWTLIGPSNSVMPSILTFSGAQTVTSGRITALAIGPTCTSTSCSVWVGAAGGGVWRSDNALAGNPNWVFSSGSFGTNAIGALTFDAASNTLYAGTGEPNASGDSEAGVGIYKSTDRGATWTFLSGSSFGLGRAISSIVVDPTSPNTLYVGSARAVRGVSSVTGGSTSNPPGAAPFGLYKSTDGGATFSLIWNGAGTLRGVNKVELDPNDHTRVYAAAFGVGIWRSAAGATFEQVYVPASNQNTQRTEFALANKNGRTRIYAGDGTAGNPYSRFARTDDAGVPAASIVWKSLTSTDPASPYYATYNYCTGQCWYDNVVYSPAGYPDIVYLAGSYVYDEYGRTSNSRSVLFSTDAGETFTDESWDASSDTAPNGIHPDQHALVTVPGNPNQFFEGSDGGIVRSSGDYKDISYQCATRGVPALYMAICQQLLSRVPVHLFSLNKTLSTLQFQSLSVNPTNVKNVQGGTQDNGTWETTGSYVTWNQIMYGDGGQSGFSANNPALRFNSFFGQFHDANFQNGDPAKWVIISGPIASSPEGSAFYAPLIADPSPDRAGTIFEGSQSVWRTQDWGGNQAYLEANCPEFTTSGYDPACGDFVRIGPSGNTNLTGSGYGSDRLGGTMSALTRAKGDTGTLWAATAAGRLFISKNADAEAGSVTFTRLDSLTSNDPNRFISSIYVDAANSNHAWVSYSGYNFITPSTPGHVFDVNYNPTAGTATWTDASFNLGDLPVTSVVRDDNTGDLYASNDFSVFRLPSGATSWVLAGAGLPMVEVAGLTIVPGSRTLYAATHGRSAWMLALP